MLGPAHVNRCLRKPSTSLARTLDCFQTPTPREYCSNGVISVVKVLVRWDGRYGAGIARRGAQLPYTLPWGRRSRVRRKKVSVSGARTKETLLFKRDTQKHARSLLLADACKRIQKESGAARSNNQPYEQTSTEIYHLSKQLSSDTTTQLVPMPWAALAAFYTRGGPLRMVQ